MPENNEDKLENRLALGGCLRGLLTQSEQAEKCFEHYKVSRQVPSAENIKELVDLYAQFDRHRKTIKAHLDTLKGQQESYDA